MATSRHSYSLSLAIGLLGMLLAGAPGAIAGPGTASAASGCSELLRNGSFEDLAGWTINPSTATAIAVEYPVHSGRRAMRLGIAEGTNRNSYSSIQQQVHLPASAVQLTLRFHAYTVSDSPRADEQLLALLDPTSGSVIATPWRSQSGGRTWREEVVELTAYRDRTVLLYFNVRNDGSGGRTAMVLDDVSLQACGSTTASATPWPTLAPSRTATATYVMRTPSPTAATPAGPCQRLYVPNGDFEAYGQWQLGATTLQPAYVGGRGADGGRAMMLGNDGRPNAAAYSSIRQEVTVPSWATGVRLHFWFWPLAEPPGTGDRQELLLLHPGSERVEAVLWRDRRDDRRWIEASVDLTQYRGRTEVIYFNVYNDGRGGRTAMYLDQVYWELCGRALSVPTEGRPRGTSAATLPQATSAPTVARPSAEVTRFRTHSTPTTTPTPLATPTRPQMATTAHTEALVATALPTKAAWASPAPSPVRLPLTGDWKPSHWILLGFAALLLVASVAALVLALFRH